MRNPSTKTKQRNPSTRTKQKARTGRAWHAGDYARKLYQCKWQTVRYLGFDTDKTFYKWTLSKKVSPIRKTFQQGYLAKIGRDGIEDVEQGKIDWPQIRDLIQDDGLTGQGRFAITAKGPKKSSQTEEWHSCVVAGLYYETIRYNDGFLFAHKLTLPKQNALDLVFKFVLYGKHKWMRSKR